MTEEDPNLQGSLDSGVPGLIDQYRQQRRAWLAQADELVRLRDEVRAAAEREAMDIVTAARRDVRQIVVEARRELMVLTAQLQAAMDAVEQSAPMQLRNGDGHAVDDEAAEAQTSLGFTREMVQGARREVRGVLDEARAEIEALASEAPMFPTEGRSLLDHDFSTIKVLPDDDPVAKTRVFGVPDAPRAEARTPSTFGDSGIFAESQAPFSSFDRPEIESPPFISRVLTPSGSGSRGRSALTFAALFAALGVLLTAGTVWWLFSSSRRPSREPATPVAATAPLREPSTTSAENPAIPVSSPTKSSTSLTIEARRSSWIRASIDGQPDAGRLYQAGETREIIGARSVVIRAGDAGAVYVSVNGEQAQPLGADRTVLSRRYTIDAAPNVSTTAASTASRGLDEGRPTVPSSASPVRLAVENSPRRETPRAEVRQPGAATPVPGTSPAASNSSATATSGKDAPAGRPDLVVAGQQWLDAYQRRDRQAMSNAGSENISVTDERSATERFPSSQNSVQRELDQVELALTGDTALLTARMTERTEGGSATPHVSRVSQIWVRRAGQWRLADVRIMAESRLNQIVR